MTDTYIHTHSGASISSFKFEISIFKLNMTHRVLKTQSQIFGFRVETSGFWVLKTWHFFSKPRVIWNQVLRTLAYFATWKQYICLQSQYLTIWPCLHRYSPALHTRMLSQISFFDESLWQLYFITYIDLFWHLTSLEQKTGWFFVFCFCFNLRSFEISNCFNLETRDYI